MRPTRLLIIVLASLLLLAAPAHAAAGLRTGFTDSDAFFSSAVPDNITNLTRAKSAGAGLIRLSLPWKAVAPTPPPAGEGSDPGWSGYDWSALDSALRGVAQVGLTPLPVVNAAPAWAEGAGRPAISKYVPAGTWRPSATAFKSFAVALARRYSGRYPDPLDAGATLPRIRYWQAWNEPNLYNEITPQWTKRAKGYRAASPGIYRSLLNAFYAGVKSVSASNYVVTAGTAPFGDLQAGDPRMPPAYFWRQLLCVSGRAKPKAKRCPVVRFDAIAHHPYPIGPPRRHARNADDVVVPDLAKITKPLTLAIRKGTVRPAGRKPLWITEISWDSAPDPDGLTQADQAQYLEGAFNTLWKQGARVVIWFVMRDEAPLPNYASSFQAGIFNRGATVAQDTPKPSYTAFLFPFTAYRSEGVASLWGMSPAGAGPVRIQALNGSTWRTVATLSAGSNRIFQGRLRVGRGTSLRAVFGAQTSLTWKTL